MAEKEVGAGSEDNHIEEGLEVILIELSSQVEAAKLRNIEFEVVTEVGLEIGVDATIF